MIGGGKVVGRYCRLDAELIADNKREKKLLGLSVILSPWGRPNQKSGRAEGGNKLILSYNARWYTQTLTDSHTDSHFRTTTAGLSGTVGNCLCVCVAFWLFPTNELIGKKVRSFLGGRVKVVLYCYCCCCYYYCITTPNFYLFYSFNFH